MNKHETHRTNDPTDPNQSAVTLRAARSGPSRAGKVLFIAASALGVAAMPGVAGQLLGTLGSALVGTAHAASDECTEEIQPGYEQNVIKFLQANGIELPAGIESFVSLFELSKLHDATILRDRKITLFINGKGKVLPAPEGLYVFPDGLVVEIVKGGLIGSTWGEEFTTSGGPWAMCRANGGEDGPWVDC